MMGRRLLRAAIVQGHRTAAPDDADQEEADAAMCRHPHNQNHRLEQATLAARRCFLYTVKTPLVGSQGSGCGNVDKGSGSPTVGVTRTKL
jgi:hypothetical protein